MQRRMGSVLILVLLALMLLHKEAIACGHITTWVDDDASFFGINAEDISFVNEPRKSIVSDRQRTNFYLTTGTWNVSGPATWRLNVSVYSYMDAAEAAADFTLMRPAVPAWDFIDDEAGFLTYYQKTVYQKFELMGIHQSCIVSVGGWGNTTGLDVDELRSRFIALFEKAKILINSKCGLGTNAPSISFYPYEPMGYLLELSILKDKGFLIEVQDEDGVAKLDWNTFKVEINNLVDITGHFLKTVVDQGLLAQASQINSGKTLQVMIKLNPEKLMTEHNLFAVAGNGQVSVSLKICDLGGLCGSNEYQVYFGPFCIVSEIGVVRPPAENSARIDLKNVFLGNTGKQCDLSLYYAILNENSGKIWTYQIEERPPQDSVWIMYQNPNDLTPYMQGEKWPAGYYAALETRVAYVRDWSQFGDGRLHFVLGILDEETGSWAIDITPLLSP